MQSTTTIASTFQQLREKRQIALMPFLAAGYPDLPTTAASILAMQENGASMIELGFPFSDPIADGPTIQAAFTEALTKKLKVADVFAMTNSIKSKLEIPLIAMISYSMVFRYGVARFVGEAKAAGFSGLITPDLPPPEAQSVSDTVRAGGLDTILLVAPTTSPERRKKIARLCSGFVYYLSVSGITGERDRLPEDVEHHVRAMKALTDVPVCVGFGIHRAEQVAQLAGVADGAIVGSAFVKRMKEQLGGGPVDVAEVVGTYCRELLTKVR